MPFALRDARHVLVTGAAGAIGGALADALRAAAPAARFTLVDMDAASAESVAARVGGRAGLVPLRGASYYGAAKAGLAMASEIARLELADQGVHVLTVYPGPVASGLERRARAQLRASLLSRAVPMGNPADLARRIIDALDRRRPRVVYPPLYALAHRALGVSRAITSTLSPAPTE